MRPGILERGAELAVLAAAVRDAAGGHGSVVLISGEAGFADAVLARVRRLDPVTQDVLEQLAVVPARRRGGVPGEPGGGPPLTGASWASGVGDLPWTRRAAGAG